jgi:hypothetical protein
MDGSTRTSSNRGRRPSIRIDKPIRVLTGAEGYKDGTIGIPPLHEPGVNVSHTSRSPPEDPGATERRDCCFEADPTVRRAGVLAAPFRALRWCEALKMPPLHDAAICADGRQHSPLDAIAGSVLVSCEIVTDRDRGQLASRGAQGRARYAGGVRQRWQPEGETFI